MKLILIRGLPGSGKSTIARLLYRAGYQWFEADSYFLDEEGDYQYDASKVKEAHIWCQEQTLKALQEGDSVVVSNTFTQLWELQPYIDMASTVGIVPNILEAKGAWPSVHNVPSDIIQKMQDRWEPLKS